MPLKEIQKQVDDWVQQYQEGYWEPQHQFVRLVEEVGELARELNHHYGSKRKKASEGSRELADELTDVMFTLVALANNLGIDLDESFSRVMAKYYSRDKDRFERK